MEKVLENYEPKKVLYFFEEISKIPHGSYNEKSISDYFVNFAKERNLKYIQEDSLNVIIYKDATSDMKNKPSVIIQGHMDMVCEKNADTDHNFETDPLKLEVNGDFISAKGTTLGADNGIAVAMALAILDSDDISHPAIEALFTVEEEVGLTGAKLLDTSNLKSDIMINLDTDTEGIFLTSCAGGLKAEFIIDTEFLELSKDYTSYELKIRGLKGGHSGAEIHKQRGNSNVILGRILNELSNEVEIFVSNIEGGAKDNAIPREANATVHFLETATSKVQDIVEKVSKDIKNEFRVSDSNLEVILEKVDAKNKVYTQETLNKIVSSLVLIPNGIDSMSLEIEGLVETSNNVGVIINKGETISILCALRSSVATKKYDLLNRMKTLANVIGCKCVANSDYPAWEFNPNSVVVGVFAKTYNEVFGVEPKIDAIHAGLECGILSEKMPNVDIVAFGPDIIDAHTPDERVSISSIEKCYKLLINGFKNL